MNKSEVVKKLIEIKTLADDCLRSLGETGREDEELSPGSSIVKESVDGTVVEIVNKIKDCPESEKIETKALNLRNSENRILLPFYICNKYFPNRRLSTGDIEKITSDLGTKIKMSNVLITIKKSSFKYLEADSSRVKGKATHYKLNRRGLLYFESVLNSVKVSENE